VRWNLLKRKHKLIKVNVSRGVNPTGHGIIAPVTFGVGRIAKEDTWSGTRGEFMRRSGRCARIIETPEGPKTIVRRRDTE
jgi:hypothetical protein